MAGPSEPFYRRAAARWPVEDHGKCLTCGLLAEPEGRNDLEIRDMDRRTGMHIDGGRPVLPFCFVAAASLGDDLRPPPPSMQWPIASDVVAVIAKDRRCPEWYPYTPGASPLWHFEQTQMMHLESHRQDMARLDKALTWRIAIIGFILAGAQIAVALIAIRSPAPAPSVIVNVPSPVIASPASPGPRPSSTPS